jgi:heat shock protein HslJ
MDAAACRLAVAALFCAGCTSIHADQRTFEGTSWHMTAINGVRTPPYRVWPYRLWFGGGTMRGVICNNFQAPYIVGDGLIQLSGMQNTERGCDGATMQFEESAFAILRRRPMRMSWVSSRKLTLSNGAGSIDLEVQR